MEVFIQGLTLAHTVLDLRTDLFAHGQLYTALLRVSQRHQPPATFPAPPLRPRKMICIARRQFLVRMKENSLTSPACSCQDVAVGVRATLLAQQEIRHVSRGNTTD